MPAGRGKVCEACYWEGVLRKRITLNQAGLGACLAEHFESFSQWLAATRGTFRAANLINRYLAFFQEMDRLWGRLVDYKTLLGHFHADGLRRFRLATQWMEAQGHIVIDDKLREADSEYERIKLIAARVSSQLPNDELWFSYRDKLEARLAAGKITLRTMRLTLSASADLLLGRTGKDPDSTLSQVRLDAYLTEKPGQRANITGFVNHVNATAGMSLSIQMSSRDARRSRRRRLERSLIAMMNTPGSGSAFLRKWARAAMPYFHDCRLERRAVLVEKDDGLVIYMGDLAYWIPLPPSPGSPGRCA